VGRARGIRAQGLVALGLSCTVGGACTAPEAVLFDLVADVEGDYLGFVSGTHVELRPRIEGTWFDRQDDELPDELWVFDQPPGLAFGRYPVVRELSGGHKLPTPKVRLVRDDDVDLVSYREAGGSVRMVGVEGCPLVRVFKVGLSRPRREVILYDFGSSALVQNTDEESAEDLEVVHADGCIQFARVFNGVPRIGGSAISEVLRPLEGRRWMGCDSSTRREGVWSWPRRPLPRRWSMRESSKWVRLGWK
jgi:hypothetical protein